jgi:Caspase domain
MQTIRSIVLGAAILALSGTGAFADKRVALVIGNSAYQNVARLANPAGDAAALAATFRNANFDIVESRADLSAAEMRRTLRDFADKARDADIAVVYFAGHGIELDGTNYLIPVDAVLERDTDVYDETFALDRVLVAVEPAKRLRLVILDACRDNPFSKTMKRTSASRSIERGLAKVEPSSSNTMIAFAAKAGSTAMDGDRNSPFATALVKYITRPGLDLRKAFGFVRDDVLKATGNRQEPFVYGSLGGDDVSLVPAPVAAAPASVPSGPINADIRRDYELAERVGTKAGWDAFIGNYPSGFYTELAKAQREKLVARPESAALDKAADHKAADGADVGADKTAHDDKPAGANPAPAAGQAADLASAERPAEGDVRSGSPAVADIPRLLQSELRRVGCNTGSIDGNWNAAAQKSLELFNKNAGTKLGVQVASLDALEVVKSKPERICPLLCDPGDRADGERCTRITCRAGFEVGDDNSCERIKPKRRPARHELRSVGSPRRTASEPRAMTRTQSSAQIICLAAGCRPVRKGCRLEMQGYSASNQQSGQVEVCN